MWGVRKRNAKGISMIRFTCVEPCIHNTPIYRQTWAQTAQRSAGQPKTGHTKGPHLTGSPLECRRDGASLPSNRRATRGTIAARPTNGRRPRAGGKTRRPRRGDETRRPASGFHSTNAPAGHQDGRDPVTPSLAHAESRERGQVDGTPRLGVVKTKFSDSAIIKITEPLGGL